MRIIDIQPTITQAGEIPLLLGMLEDNTHYWRSHLGRISIDTLCWQARPEGHSIGMLLLHNAAVEAYWLQQVLAGEATEPELWRTLRDDKVDQFAGKWGKPPKKRLSWYYEQQDLVRHRTLEIVSQQTDTTALFGGETQFSLRWLVHHVITHEAYHCGQMLLLADLVRATIGESRKDNER